MFAINVMYSESDGNRERDALRDFGFDDSFLRDYLRLAEPGDMPGRVVEVQRGRFRAACRDSEGSLLEVEAQASGALAFASDSPADFPAVGDWVVMRPVPGGAAAIRAVLPRRSAFVRKAAGDTDHDRVEAQVVAANVDYAFIVMAAGRDWNPRRLERYLTLAWESGAQPVVVAAKTDLAEDEDALVAQAESLAPGVPCVPVCALEGRGLEALAPWLGSGKTVVLLGSSGAGKSTLLNALAGAVLASVGEVRADDERGRHTTTHRELFRLSSGALVIDTPGMRELQLWSSEEDVAAAFSDIEALSAQCRFRDCGHGAEPGCAVRAALASGALDEGRYEGWRKLMREVAFLRTREDRVAKEAMRQRWKAINKSMRGYSKERRAKAGSSRA